MSSGKSPEALAREWLRWRNESYIEHEVSSLAALLTRVAAEARREALEEAATECDGVIADFRRGVISAAAWTARVAAGRIRALVKP